MTNKPIYVVDIIGDIVNRTSSAIPHWLPEGTRNINKLTLLQIFQQYDNKITGIYYEYGYKEDIASLITQKDESVNTRNKKYPCICLQLPFEEDINSDIGLINTSNLRIVFVYSSSPEYVPSERYDYAMKPILYPLYAEFMNQLYISGLFQFEGSKIPHVKTDKPYFDGSEKANGLNDFVDAIVVTKLDLKIRINNC